MCFTRSLARVDSCDRWCKGHTITPLLNAFLMWHHLGVFADVKRHPFLPQRPPLKDCPSSTLYGACSFSLGWMELRRGLLSFPLEFDIPFFFWQILVVSLIHFL